MIKHMPMALWIVPVVAVVIALVLNFIASEAIQHYLFVLYYPAVTALLTLVLIFIGFAQYREDKKESGLWTILFFTAAAMMLPLFFITMAFSVLALLKSTTDSGSAYIIGDAWQATGIAGLIVAIILIAHFMIVRGRTE